MLDECYVTYVVCPIMECKQMCRRKRKALKCKPSAHVQLLAHGAWLVAWAIIIIMAMGAIINTHVHR